MPYIKQVQRDRLDPLLHDLQNLIENIEAVQGGSQDGVMNYIVSTLVAKQFDLSRYSELARAMAVFTCAQHELYRRMGSIKEDAAIEENGDIDAYKRWDSNE